MVAVFVIGILAMLISITGSQLLTSSGYDTTSTQTTLGESLTLVNTTDARALAVSDYKSVACTISSIQNTTNSIIGTGNYTESAECYILALTTTYENVNWSVNYTYTFEAVSSAGSVINSTITSVADVPDNFSLWLVVGGLVVVIGLIAFVIVTLRGTGMMGA